jgi:hypothetical protein
MNEWEYNGGKIHMHIPCFELWDALRGRSNPRT